MNFFRPQQTYPPLRDTSRDRKYWDKLVKDYTKLITECLRILQKSNKLSNYSEATHCYELVTLYIALFTACYSRGDNLNELKIWYSKTIEAIEHFRNLPFLLDEPLSFEDGIFYGYWKALWLVSLNILLGRDEAELARILSYIGNEGKDSLLEELIALKTANRLKPENEQLIYPEPFKWLYFAIKSEGIEREQNILLFLDNYHSRIIAEKGGTPAGCWSFELTAFVQQLKIDDSKFAQHPCYPRDLIFEISN